MQIDDEASAVVAAGPAITVKEFGSVIPKLLGKPDKISLDCQENCESRPNYSIYQNATHDP